MLESEVASDAACERTGLFHRVHLPETEDSAPRPAVVMVHGRAGDAKVMWTFSKIVREIKPVVVAPQGIVEDEIGGHSWWPVGDGKIRPMDSAPPPLDPLLPAIDRLTNFVKLLPQVYPVDPQQVYAFGFSQGAALVSAVSLREPQLLRAVALLAGFVPRATVHDDSFVSPAVLSGAQSLPPYFMAHGTEDKILPLARAEYGKAALERFGAQVSFHTEAVGHKVGSNVMKELKSWFAEVSAG